MLKDTVIVIPTCRRPPVRTLEVYDSKSYPVIVMCDPSVYKLHRKYYKSSSFFVTKGDVGLSAQLFLCYKTAKEEGFDWWFRVDDDLADKTFVHKEPNRFCSLVFAMKKARECAISTDTSLAGFMNGSNRFWFGEGYKRTYGLIHGGAQLVRSSSNPSKYIDRTLRLFEDVYRSCAHRSQDGAVGRVQFIGFDKKLSCTTKDSGSISAKKLDPNLNRSEIKRILDKWSDYVSCNGTRTINGGSMTIANWRMKRHKNFRK